MTEIIVNATKLKAIQTGTNPIFPSFDPARRAPKLSGDIRILYSQQAVGDIVENTFLTLNHAYNGEAEYGFPELEGTVWVVSNLEGWFNLAEPSMPNIERGFGDGSFDISGRFLSRDITIRGSILITKQDRAEIEELSQRARTILLRAFNLVKRGAWLVVAEDEYQRASFVRLSGRPEIETVNAKGRIEFSIGLRASDPIKYEWVDITEPGDVPAYEVVTGNGYNLSTISRATSYTT